MKVSRNGQYALISVVDLAINARETPASIADIASRQNIDQRYLGQIFFKLKNADVLSSVRGKNGGYLLKKHPSEITAGDVVRAIEGDLAPTKCSIDDDAALCCETYDACFTHGLWRDMAKKINNTLDGISISGLADQYKRECES